MAAINKATTNIINSGIIAKIIPPKGENATSNKFINYSPFLSEVCIQSAASIDKISTTT